MEEVEVMTKYETIATVVSIIAVSLSVLIPLIQWVWRKWIMRSKVSFYPTGQATLFFNQSGSYIRLNAVIESERKATTIKKLKVVLTRERDELKRNLVWTCLISPVNQNLLGNFVQTTEAAHPFRVEADSVACAFAEYCNPSDTAGIKSQKVCSGLIPFIQHMIIENTTYEKTLSVLLKSDEYRDAKNELFSDFFWEIGKYRTDVTVEYGKRNKKTFSYEFSVSELEYSELKKNIDEALIVHLKKCYNIPMDFKTPVVEVRERQE